MDDVAPVIPLFQLKLSPERSGRARLSGEFQVLGRDGKGDERVGVEGEETGFSRGDLEVPEPFVSGAGRGSTFGDKDGSGDAVDIEVALRLPIGVHGNEGVDGVHGIDMERVDHDSETRFV